MIKLTEKTYFPTLVSLSAFSCCDCLLSLFSISADVQWCKGSFSVSQRCEPGPLPSELCTHSIPFNPQEPLSNSWWYLCNRAETQQGHLTCPKSPIRVWWEHGPHVCLISQLTCFYCCAAWPFKDSPGLGALPFLILFVTNVFEVISNRNSYIASVEQRNREASGMAFWGINQSVYFVHGKSQCLIHSLQKELDTFTLHRSLRWRKGAY